MHPSVSSKTVITVSSGWGSVPDQGFFLPGHRDVKLSPHVPPCISTFPSQTPPPCKPSLQTSSSLFTGFFVLPLSFHSYNPRLVQTPSRPPFTESCLRTATGATRLPSSDLKWSRGPPVVVSIWVRIEDFRPHQGLRVSTTTRSLSPPLDESIPLLESPK